MSKEEERERCEQPSWMTFIPITSCIDARTRFHAAPCITTTVVCACKKQGTSCTRGTCINAAMCRECDTSTCSQTSPDRCYNRAFQRGVGCSVAVVDTGTRRGMGLFCKSTVYKGSFVGEYVGEWISGQEHRRRRAKHMGGPSYVMRIANLNVYIDARRYGNEMRFMNHSCSPNCFTEVWIVGPGSFEEAYAKGALRVGIFAKHDVPQGTELTISYSKSFFHDTPCLCGSTNCWSKKE